MDSCSPSGGAVGRERSAEDEKDQSVWSLAEAMQKQILQIGSSACGATAVVNILQALGFDIPSDVVDRCVQTRLRKNDAPLAEYLMSRCVAGATHQQLIEGAEKASEGRVVGRFFSFYPERSVELTSWLASWMRKGAVPVVTMNMQVAVPEGKEIPDAWHHQMIFGVGAEGIYMTNPLEIEESSLVKRRLCSESLLLVRRQDVLSRLSDGSDFSMFTRLPDHSLWEQLDVVGQIERIVSSDVPGEVPDHVVIPAAYRSGVTMFTLRHSELTNELLSASELPLLY
ncbi:uncharacterized protein LOC121287227 [Carcharodon carcharias]|uniref:uncharacterized protein LOC121287227 n=1 Tax=Carcharodon carcharias TaxID=13397 RepID=UPI001B7DC8D6|nr:uncharacterized protein LOC121287227 [Carcharodon carcharias]XP_041060848.1 uncharacterized protein LOC121287227 [Carcharodon carcharias]XP_041060849.1 uncharacterized protein LOC121287227 [Carcharodon carcharias]